MKIITDTHSGTIRKASRMLKLLSNLGRLAIVDLLLEKGRLTVNEIATSLDLSQSNTSQHLKSMMDIEMLGSERDGKNTFYFIRNTGLDDLLHCLNNCCEVKPG